MSLMFGPSSVFGMLMGQAKKVCLHERASLDMVACMTCSGKSDQTVMDDTFFLSHSTDTFVIVLRNSGSNKYPA